MSSGVEETAAFFAELAAELGGAEGAELTRRKLEELATTALIVDQVTPSETTLALARIMQAARLASRIGPTEICALGDLAADFLARHADTVVVGETVYSRNEYARQFLSSGKATAPDVVAGGDLRQTPDTDIERVVVSIEHGIAHGLETEAIANRLLDDLLLETRSPLRAALIGRFGLDFHTAVGPDVYRELAAHEHHPDVRLLALRLYSMLADGDHQGGE
jgi:hypothetical protein